MGEIGGFLKKAKSNFSYRDPRQRIEDFQEFIVQQSDEELQSQGARCMDCGVPFCHSGCPLGNLIPDWNDMVYRDQWKAAIEQLHATNNFPEWTGRLCPAPCEAACVLEIIENNSVTIKQIELAIADRAWREGWIRPEPPRRKSGRSVAVVGSGPAGMAAAQQLRRAGHNVSVWERDEAAGGLVRFGVPDFKIEKRLVERRVEQLLAEGVEFHLGVDIGRDKSPEELHQEFDAVVLATGSRVPRDLDVSGRNLPGIYFAMDYLYQRNRAISGQQDRGSIDTRGDHVVVIGGGDTGADCVGNALRQGAASVIQLEILERPPERRPDEKTPWPQWPVKFRLSYAIEEANASERGRQEFAVQTKEFLGQEKLEGLLLQGEDGREIELRADWVFLAMGFLHPEQELPLSLGCRLDGRGNIHAGTYQTSQPGIFAAGDARRGQSLIVWAIQEGRQCARMVDRYLKTSS